MYWTKCNWCGRTLYDGDYAVVSIEIKRQRQTKLQATWAAEVRPTLHFCVGEALDLDRMGLDSSGYDGRSADCCYERAIATINGVKTDTPDLGLEWQLVPVGGTETGATPEPTAVRSERSRTRPAAAAPLPAVRAVEDADETETEGEYADRKRRRRSWTALTRDERQQLVLDTLGEQQLTGGELIKAINGKGFEIYDGDIKQLLSRTVAEGRMDRTTEPATNRYGYRYRYFRPQIAEEA